MPPKKAKKAKLVHDTEECLEDVPSLNESPQEQGGETEDDDITETELVSKKPSRKGITFTEQEEEDLANWVKANPILYDKRNRDYKDKEKKWRLWNEKGKDHGCEGKSTFQTNI